MRLVLEGQQGPETGLGVQGKVLFCWERALMWAEEAAAGEPVPSVPRARLDVALTRGEQTLWTPSDPGA